MNEARLMYWEELGYGAKPLAVLIAEQDAWFKQQHRQRKKKHFSSKQDGDIIAEAIARMYFRDHLRRMSE